MCCQSVSYGQSTSGIASCKEIYVENIEKLMLVTTRIILDLFRIRSESISMELKNIYL